MDNRFESLIAMNDTGEKESNGSLITAKYGKGNIFCIPMWYRVPFQINLSFDHCLTSGIY